MLPESCWWTEYWVLADARLGRGTVGSWPGWQPQHESQEELFFFMEMEGLTGLSLCRQCGNEPPYAELEPEPLLAVHSLRTRLLGHHHSCWREEKALEARAGLAEIPGEKAAAGENRTCYKRTNWIASGGHGQELHGRRNTLSHPYGSGWNRWGMIYMYILECLRAFLHKTKSNQEETAWCCHWRR